MKKKLLGITCILLGLVVCAVPFLRERDQNQEQNKLLIAYDQSMANIEDIGQTEAEQKTDLQLTEDVMGILKIPSIDLEQPILYGATSENLDLSVAAIEPAIEPGEDGNLAIAGHRSRTFGRHFNRLDEVTTGVEITVETTDETFHYEVTEKYVVEADEVWVLKPPESGAEITLITCYYPAQGETQRLIVKGQREKGEN